MAGACQAVRAPNEILADSSVVLPFGITAGHALSLGPFGKCGDGVKVGEISGCVSLGIIGFPRSQHSSGDVVLCNSSCCFGAAWGEVLMSCVCTEKSRKGEILDPFLCTSLKTPQILKHGLQRAVEMFQWVIG